MFVWWLILIFCIYFLVNVNRMNIWYCLIFFSAVYHSWAKCLIEVYKVMTEWYRNSHIRIYKVLFSVYQITHFMWQMYITEIYNFVIIKKCRNSLRKAMRIIYARDMKAVCMFLYRYTIDPFYELHFCK